MLLLNKTNNNKFSHKICLIKTSWIIQALLIIDRGCNLYLHNKITSNLVFSESKIKIDVIQEQLVEFQIWARKK